MLVFRVELEDGIGPYISDRKLPHERMRVVREVCGKLCTHSGSSKHPIAYGDCPGFSSGHYCAFTSIADLEDWFDGFMDLFRKHKYFIATYEVDKQSVSYGSRQVAFRKDEAEFISRELIQS